MLEGFDTEWKYIGHENKATFTNLDPGTYYLYLKASNRAGYWSGEKNMLKIVIKKALSLDTISKISFVLKVNHLQA